LTEALGGGEKKHQHVKTGCQPKDATNLVAIEETARGEAKGREGKG